MIKLLFVDDRPIVRDGMRSLLSRQTGLEIVAETGDGRIALDLAKELRPDVVLLRALIPELNAPDCARQILALLPQVKIVALASSIHKCSVEDLFNAGASAFVHEKDTTENLFGAIKGVLKNKLYISPEAYGVIRDMLIEKFNPQSNSFTLSMREREIIQLISEEYTTQEIARRLHLSTKTIEFHRRNLFEKLKVKNIAGLTKYAIRLGLTPLD